MALVFDDNGKAVPAQVTNSIRFSPCPTLSTFYMLTHASQKFLSFLVQ